MADLGWQELVVVLVIVMLLFGVGKLPEVAKSLGQGVKEFRREANGPLEATATGEVAPVPPVATTGVGERAVAGGIARDAI